MSKIVYAVQMNNNFKCVLKFDTTMETISFSTIIY